MCSMTTESLPPENSRTGLSASAVTSRMMWTDSFSSASRWSSPGAPAGDAGPAALVVVLMVVVLIGESRIPSW